MHPLPPVLSHLEKQTSDSSEGERKIVALIGDSLSTGFHVGSQLGMLWRMWRAWKGNWFVDAPDSGLKIQSIFERLNPVAPILARQHATATAKVDEGGPRTRSDLLTATWHFSHQVDEVLAGEFPDLLLLWIGHNNVDWHRQVAIPTPASFDALSDTFVLSYGKQLQRLLEGAMTRKKRSVIVVYGLGDFASFFRAHRQAEHRHAVDPSRYPYLPMDHKYFDSLRPEHRQGMIELAAGYNRKLHELCRTLTTNLRRTDVRLVYSDALARAELAEAEMLHPVDAWHPSPSGHVVLAENAYPTIEAQLRYLGWVTGAPSNTTAISQIPA
jgi:lysophospholipase L1-like esterase